MSRGPWVVAVKVRQKTRLIHRPVVRKIAVHLLNSARSLAGISLAIHLIGREEMARINQKFLQHPGSTDVITFDYSDASGRIGEIFISVDDALQNAGKYRTTCPLELARYLVHGVLHLQGYDDRIPAERKRMKKQEADCLEMIRKEFSPSELARMVSGKTNRR